MDKAALGQVFSLYIGFLANHHHPSSKADTIGQELASTVEDLVPLQQK
jgi:hypothetical protein